MRLLIWFCLLPLWLKAQKAAIVGLPPGTYRNLKPTKPIVLDTGVYTLIGLVWKSPFGGFRGPWGEVLARPGRSLCSIVGLRAVEVDRENRFLVGTNFQLRVLDCNSCTTAFPFNLYNEVPKTKEDPFHSMLRIK